MITLSENISPENLLSRIETLWEASATKIDAINREFDKKKGTPVFTVNGKYDTRGWTEWTQGFQYGAALLQYDATEESRFLEMGRNQTVQNMATHVTHFGVHDHGFNNVSTYGALWRMMNEGKVREQKWERRFYEMALMASGAVQARRWTQLNTEEGYVYSFNGPHSLFSDTIRSMRALSVAHTLGHRLDGEHDEKVSLLKRILQHAEATSKYNVYFGEGRDGYDIRGRVVHESIFNLNDGFYRCPSTQQGFSPFTTWTRGHAWVLCGYPEQLEWLATRSDDELEPFGGREKIETSFLRTALATADFYLEQTPSCGVPYWDTGAPNLHKLGDWQNQPADPYNAHEPIDASAAAISAQGLLRLGTYLNKKEAGSGEKYLQAAWKVLDTLLSDLYLSTNPNHHGLLLHVVYHHPNAWDNIPSGQKVPCNESCMWGDYHFRELALLAQRILNGQYYTFF